MFEIDPKQAGTWPHTGSTSACTKPAFVGFAIVLFSFGCNLSDDSIRGLIGRSDSSSTDSSSVTINAGASFANSGRLNVGLQSSLSQYYSIATSKAQCEASTNWQTFTGSIELTLEDSEGLTSVWAKYKSGTQISACVKDEITIDTTPPTTPSRMAWPSSFPSRTLGDTPVIDWNLDSTDAESGIKEYQVAITTAFDTNTTIVDWTAFTPGTQMTGLGALAAGTEYAALVRAVDQAGNTSAPLRAAMFTSESTTYPINDDLMVSSLEVIDYNLDGFVDLLFYDPGIYYLGSTSDFNRSPMGYMLNDGAGNFSAQVIINGPYNCRYFFKDINGDNRPDCFDGKTLYLQRSNGTYSPIAQALSLSWSDTTLRNLRLVDFDKDGDLDVVSFVSSNFVILRNDGFTFTLETLFTSTFFPTYIEIGDMDGDNWPDVITANSTTDEIGWYKNDPGYPYSSFLTSVTNPGGLFIGDLDGDTDLDIATFSFNDGNLRAGFNNGSGGLASSSTIDSLTSLRVTSCDWNNDGRMDFFITNSGTTQRVRLNSGAGTFSTVAISGLNNHIGISSISDINGDGSQDIIFSASSGYSLNNGSNSFAAVTTFASQFIASDRFTGIQSKTTGDIDSDGDVDIFLSTDVATYLYLNDGSEKFTRVGFADAPCNYMVISNYDGDADQDLICSGSNLVVYVNDGSMNFTPRTIRTGMNSGWETRIPFVITDIDGDSDMDFVTVEGSYWSSDVFFMLSDGAATPTYSTITQIVSNRDAITAVGVADLDGVNNKDIVVVNNATSGNIVELFTNNGSQVFTPSTLDSGGGFGYFNMKVLDFDVDGDQDIYYVQEFGTHIWLQNDGSGSFTKVTTGIYDSWNIEFDIADINSDGALDVVSFDRNTTSSDIYVSVNSGDDTNFTPHLMSDSQGAYISNLSFVDLDSDGSPEILSGSLSESRTSATGHYLIWIHPEVP